ncbi:MAG: DedA family protein [Negativicutes bacterium]|nr:DedA family protein [Negativicutes bacterium]
MDDGFTRFIGEYGYLAVFALMTLEGLCVPVFAELVLGFAGFLVFSNHLQLIPTIVSAAAGSLLGSNLIYWLMRRGGRRLLLRWSGYLRLSPRRIDSWSAWLDRYGAWIIIPWRQLPVVRTKISIVAGLLDMPYRHFLPPTAVGIAVWCSIGTLAGYHLGNNWRQFIDFFVTFGHYLMAAGTAAAAAGLLYWHRRRQRR